MKHPTSERTACWYHGIIGAYYILGVWWHVWSAWKHWKDYKVVGDNLK